MQRLTRSWSGYSTAEWRLWLRWVAATAVGLALGFGVAGIATGAVAERPGVGNLLSVSWQLTMGLCLGAITSLVQYLILRPHVPRARWWMLCITLGAMLGAVVGAWVGMGVVMFTLGIVGGPCSAIIRQDLCFPATFYLGFVAAGGAAGMIAGTAIGVLLKMVEQAWTQEWIGPLAAAWAAGGALFWALAAPLLGQRLEGGILGTSITLTSGLVMGAIGLTTGAVVGAISGVHLVRLFRTPAPTGLADS